MHSSPPLIFLIGMPGVGKTWWGNKIAIEYGLPFVDVDVLIEQQEQDTITSLFKRFGETGFREKEHFYLKQLISTTDAPTIIASGGGTPCFNHNLQLMKDNGNVVYLRAGIRHLLKNLETGKESRPLLASKPDPADYLKELLIIRKNIYEQAHYILDVENISVVTFEKILLSCTNRH